MSCNSQIANEGHILTLSVVGISITLANTKRHIVNDLKRDKLIRAVRFRTPLWRIRTLKHSLALGQDWTPPVSLKYLLSKVQSDTRVWMGTAYKHVPGSGPLQRLRVIDNRSVDQTSHAGMTDSNPARPSDRNVARFRQFKQTGKLAIPRDGNPATRE